MGHRNLELYYRYWANHPGIGHAAQRILAYMAHRTTDGATPPVYWEGWEALAVACGQMKGNSKVSSKQRSVRDFLKELKDAGVVISSDQAGPGVRENYALALDTRVTYVPEGSGRDITWREVRRENAGVNDPSGAGVDDSYSGGVNDPSGAGVDDSAVAGSKTPNRRGITPLPKEDQTNSKESSKRDGKEKSPEAVILRGDTQKIAQENFHQWADQLVQFNLWTKDQKLKDRDYE